MTTLILRDLDAGLDARLRSRAAAHGRTLEEEVRAILNATVGDAAADTPTRSLAEAFRAVVEPLGGVEIDPLERVGMRPIPSMDGWLDDDVTEGGAP